MQELLAEGDFVRALARQLIGTADGDDLAQDTWLAVLRGDPFSGRHVQQPRAWLGRIASRLAANRRRTDSRRAAREQGAASLRATSAPSTDEILACEHVRQRVVAAVLALDEPFRGTVLARFYECLDTPAIAARDGVEEATVRSRLKRGLERLRARLDGEHGERAAWAAPLALLGRDPSVPMLPAGVAMSTSKKMMAAAVALCLVAGLGWWGTASGVFDAAAPIAPTVAEHAAVRSTPSEFPRDATAARTNVATVAAWGEPRERLPYPIHDEPIDDVEVRVLDVATRRPIAGAEVLFTPFRVDWYAASTRSDRALHEMLNGTVFVERFGSRVRTNAAGEAMVRLPRSGGFVIASHEDGWVRTYIDPSKAVPGERSTLLLEPVRQVRVRLVADASGAPIAGQLLAVQGERRSPVVPGSGGYGTMAGPSDVDGMIRFECPRDVTALRVHPWPIAGVRPTALVLPAAFDQVNDVCCPATGSMTIELRTPGGALWPARIQASVRSQDGSSTLQNYGPVAWRYGEPGTYRVPGLALGATWDVTASVDEGWEGWVRGVVAGPTFPGRTCESCCARRASPA